MGSFSLFFFLFYHIALLFSTNVTAAVGGCGGGRRRARIGRRCQLEAMEGHMAAASDTVLLDLVCPLHPLLTANAVADGAEVMPDEGGSSIHIWPFWYGVRRETCYICHFSICFGACSIFRWLDGVTAGSPSFTPAHHIFDGALNGVTPRDALS